jgi:ABC-type transport system substrate-binding protein
VTVLACARVRAWEVGGPTSVRRARDQAPAPSSAGAGLAFALCTVAAGTPAPRAASASAGHRCLVVSGSGDTAFTRNLNPYANPVDFTWGGIYEPLVVVTQAGAGCEYKWLASDLTWSSDARTLIVTVRRGVRWCPAPCGAIPWRFPHETS